MPALQHEIDAAIEEGVKLVTLVSPIKIHSEHNHLSGVEFIKNKLGDVDSSGRRNPVPIPGSEEFMFFDTLIITIGDTPDVDYISSMKINVSKWGTLIVDEDTLETNHDGVFAGGDVVTGPNTVVDAIAAGKKVAIMIDRYLMQEELRQPPEIRLPKIYVPPVEISEEETKRVSLPTIPVEERKSSLHEVELTLSADQAKYEAHRCMRCDLEFIHEQKDGKKLELIESEDIYHG
jgi:NADH-quinone oxidoreductase subunit F